MGIFSSDEQYSNTEKCPQRLKDKLLEIIDNQIGCSDVGHFITDTQARHRLEDADTAFNELKELLENE